MAETQTSELPKVPELPPGYRVAHVDAEGGWLVGDTSGWFDDDAYGELQSTRIGAVALAWDHWFNYVASDEWRDFIAQHKDGDMARALYAEREKWDRQKSES